MKTSRLISLTRAGYNMLVKGASSSAPARFSLDRLIGGKLRAFADKAAGEPESAKTFVHGNARAITH